ncbi:MAG: glutamyl-tRNA amidotransferase [Candidatus Komeilibacteria bacterium CG11_big_fil_rev_8_21_14_0_20_36_20]|uniref:Glutamyl-tRNA amidotransferase n=1 Tax=Candidatus Komeilibacteria bacterium CG11_big_fil_rev_8_21_14_0_20_36_20 TaxID=1974477 RepID=A0A2H0NG64_9BACT|nr:MAG: glutamyl-tRNA amidotransferase [Candidatus Komeilibacteria bacterium CG11_big_fil_rev_8_21_14_0_20_36_20]PIR81198.1 MAG: glutamyl-tRNA amidotransferase [Candidatus Komeilibacteria bacterium CG10_big_fil_rev_8_21_14_0_10_36_65]PJC55162.1 MAG: glutamyl-tRNA amidotransferase [Candidatus Komeilibacteria bacterium CG_4_9_14_0_2_um_filter_36_13]
MSLQKNIEKDLQTALKDKHQGKLNTLRLLKSALHNKNIELKSKEELSDDQVIAIIRQEVKRRRDSIEAFQQGNRPELAEKEQREMDILSIYLPAMISEDALENIIDQVIAAGYDNFGQVMKEVMSRTEGKADGKTVQQLVKAKLST